MSIMNILSQFKSNNAQTVIPADNKAKLKLYVKIYQAISSRYSKDFMSKLMNVDEANGAVELATNHIDELSEAQLNEVVMQCKAMYKTAEKNLLNMLFAGFIKNPTADIYSLIGQISEPEQPVEPEQSEPEQPVEPEQSEQEQPEQSKPVDAEMFARALFSMIFAR